MKKNYFKKIASVAAASAVLTAAMANLTSVSAAGEYQLNVQKVELPAPTTDNVEVMLSVGADTEYRPDSIGLAVYFDNRLKYVKTSSDYFKSKGVLYKEASDKEGMSVIYFAAGGLESEEDGKNGIGANTDLIKLIFTLPENAAAGDVYPITWLEDENTNLYDTTSSEYRTTLIPHINNDGYIMIGAPIVTTTEATTTTPVTTVTTPTPTTVTTTVTTPAPTTTTTVTTTPVTTTTTAPGTTVTTVTTTTKATTKVVKETQKNSPNTGSSANGVAGLVATMVVAAGAAVALKKKKD